LISYLTFKEDEADKFASDLLIPAEKNEQLKNLTSEESIKSFAKEMGIHSGIVVLSPPTCILPSVILQTLRSRRIFESSTTPQPLALSLGSIYPPKFNRRMARARYKRT
jgi:hypothetical protein